MTLVVNLTNILQTTFVPIFFWQKITFQTVISENLLKTLLNEKAAHIMSMKLTPVVVEHMITSR
jgi:hypothetical protein